MFKIAVLASGGGTDFQSIIDAVESKYLNVKIEMLIASKDGIFAIERAKNHGIETHVVSRKEYGEKASDKILELVKDKVDLIVLAGFLSILDGEILEKYKNKIINIHPSLLPKYGGKGMYGLKVHQAVFENGDKESGCTVHYVTSNVDAGEIIAQDKVDISMAKSPEEIQKIVLEREWKLLPRVVKQLIK